MPDTFPDDVSHEGIDFALTQLCKVLDVDPETVTWDAATETVDGDVQAVIGNIMRSKYGEDWNSDELTQLRKWQRDLVEIFEFEENNPPGHSSTANFIRKARLSHQGDTKAG